jgi:serine protease Do
MSQKNSIPVFGLALWLACSSTASTQRDAPSTAASPAPRAAVASGDFRRQFVDVAKAVRPSVVSITSTSTVEMSSPFEGSPFEFFFRDMPKPGGKHKRQGMGSGVIVDPRGYILTNNHVVGEADELKVVLQDERELTAEIVGTDPKTDIAVIKVKLEGKDAQKGLKAASLGNSDSLEVGEWVMAVGSPFGLAQTVSAGIVSAVGRGRVGITDYEDFIQTDAAINPGNSGGPLVNLEGRVIGINTAIASRSGGNQGVGFAIPINMAKAVMNQLIDHGEVVRGYLGVFIADVSRELGKSFGYEGEGGVLVQDVSAGSPGEKAGLKPGDIILERDGKAVSDVSTFRNGIAQSKPGSSVKLTIFREGKKLSVTAKLETLPSDGVAKKGKDGAAPSGRGLALSDVTPELKARFQLGDARGAVVVRVQEGSAAADAGLQPGDLLVAVGTSTVGNAADASRLIGQAKPNAPLRLRVLREGRGLFLILPPSQAK